jgi:Tfp pilus assembly protein PilV
LRNRAFTLVEALISIFLIIASFLIVATLFHTGLRYVHRIEARNLAVVLAERRIEEMRAHARNRSGTQYGFADFSSFTAAATDPDFPGYQVSATVNDLTVFSPSEGYEPTAQTRPMPRSMKQVKVTVTWDQGTSNLSLLTLIGDPAASATPTRRFRNLNPIVVTPTAPPIPPLVAHDQDVPFSVVAYDQFDQPIEDLYFQWYIQPGDGNATTFQSVDGRSATMRNVINIPAQPPAYSGGQVVVVARAVFRGQEAFGYSPPIALQP